MVFDIVALVFVEIALSIVNAWCDTDAFLDRDASKKLIEKLESIAMGADEIKSDVDAVVKDLQV